MRFMVTRSSWGLSGHNIPADKPPCSGALWVPRDATLDTPPAKPQSEITSAELDELRRKHAAQGKTEEIRGGWRTSDGQTHPYYHNADVRPAGRWFIDIDNLEQLIAWLDEIKEYEVVMGDHDTFNGRQYPTIEIADERRDWDC